MASRSGRSSGVLSKPRYSRANATSIGGGGVAHGTVLASHAATAPPATSAADAPGGGDGSLRRSEASTSRTIHQTSAANARTPTSVTRQFARSGSRNSFDFTTCRPRNVRNTVGVSGAPVIDETVRSAWPAIIRIAKIAQAAIAIVRRDRGAVAPATALATRKVPTIAVNTPVCAASAGTNSRSRRLSDMSGCRM